MRVLMSTYGSRGAVEPLVALTVRLRELAAEVRVCAPLDCAERVADVGVPLVPVGLAAQFDKLAAAADGCDAQVATGVMPTGVWR